MGQHVSRCPRRFLPAIQGFDDTEVLRAHHHKQYESVKARAGMCGHVLGTLIHSSVEAEQNINVMRSETSRAVHGTGCFPNPPHPHRQRPRNHSARQCNPKPTLG